MFEIIFMSVMSFIFMYIGWRIWKKQQITLIHDYHYTNVSKENVKPYTEKMGKACILIGIGLLLTGVIDQLTDTFYGWIAFAVCFIGGIVMMILAQKKYNGGIF